MILPTADKSDLTRLWLHSGCKLKRNRAALALNRGVLKLRFSTGAHSTTSVGFGWENLHYCVAHPVFLQGAGHTANNIRVYWLMVTQSWQHCILICFAKNVSRIQTNNPSRHPFFRTIFNIALPDPLMFPMLFRKIVWCQFNHTFVAAVEWVASAGRQPDGRVYFVHLIFFHENLCLNWTKRNCSVYIGIVKFIPRCYGPTTLAASHRRLTLWCTFWNMFGPFWHASVFKRGGGPHHQTC